MDDYGGTCRHELGRIGGGAEIYIVAAFGEEGVGGDGIDGEYVG